MGHRKIHFQAPPAEVLPAEIKHFLAWANEETGEPALINTALRDITQLLALGVLKKSPGGGRSTSYELANL